MNDSTPPIDPTSDEQPGVDQPVEEQPAAPLEVKFYYVPNRADRRRAASKARKNRKARNQVKRH
ncbi:MAG TPA: hypothetical protein VN364_08195 [Bellilinea sp.]|nr:hypothetical protein [Bellilinea sp.]